MIKSNLKFILFLAFFGLVGGYFTALYSVEIMDPTALDQTVAQVGSLDAVILITVIQSLLYAVALGLIGRAISKKIGLWREFILEAKSLIYTAMS
ncbi:MAG: hypothetical protein J6V80_04680 [Clostridia bacterium]|nr:hypothetical protein [Clostridia bacterium]